MILRKDAEFIGEIDLWRLSGGELIILVYYDIFAL
jgi:hypothetical protein